MTQPALRAIVVEDEPAARRELVRMLDAIPDVAVVGAAEDAGTARAILAVTACDAVFLDIQLHGESGFGLLEHLTAAIHVVFVTAFDEHAVRAFDAGAVDYVLKPVDAARLTTAVNRVHQRVAQSMGERADPLLFLGLGGAPIVVRQSAIKCILADGDFSRVVCEGGGRRLVSRSLSEWQRRLPDDRFWRIHRSAIVNIQQVERVVRGVAGGYRVVVHGEPGSLRMSRRSAAELRAMLAPAE